MDTTVLNSFLSIISDNFNKPATKSTKKLLPPYPGQEDYKKIYMDSGTYKYGMTGDLLWCIPVQPRWENDQALTVDEIKKLLVDYLEPYRELFPSKCERCHSTKVKELPLESFLPCKYWLTKLNGEQRTFHNAIKQNYIFLFNEVFEHPYKLKELFEEAAKNKMLCFDCQPVGPSKQEKKYREMIKIKREYEERMEQRKTTHQWNNIDVNDKDYKTPLNDICICGNKNDPLCWYIINNVTKNTIQVGRCCYIKLLDLPISKQSSVRLVKK